MSLLMYGLLALAIIGGVSGLVYEERKAGGDKVRAELQPKLTACEGLRDTLGKQIIAQNDAVKAMEAAGAAKAADAAKALTAAEGRAKVWTDNATRLQAALTARKPDGPKDCSAAWAEIRK